MANDEKPYRQLLGIFQSSFFGFSFTNPNLPNYMGSPYVDSLVDCPSQALSQQPALSSCCVREPSSLCKTSDGDSQWSHSIPATITHGTEQPSKPTEQQ